MTRRPSLSVIITCYALDRLSDLLALLDSVTMQTYRPLETILVLESSRELFDQVSSYVGERKIPNTKVLFNSGEEGLSAARNMGVGRARGDIIAFVDDDSVLFPNWAEEMVKPYSSEDIIGVTGPAVPLWEEAGMAWFPEELYWIVSCTAWCEWDKMTEVRNGWGMNMSFRREVFDQGELFSHAFGLRDANRTCWVDPPSEDVDLSLRVKAKTGKTIVFVPTVVVKHRVYRRRLRMSFIRRRAFSVGYQRRMLGRLYPDIDTGSDPLGQEHRLLRRIARRLLPDIARTLLQDPITGWRKLSVTANALAFVAIGYLAPLSIIGGNHRR
ncbi:MAG: glycosyltransferase [Dehalococcoidia bacterium]